MSKLDYERKLTDEYDDELYFEDCFLKSKEYNVFSLYNNDRISNSFINLKANIVDLDPAIITKTIQGTEQDFLMLMNRAKEFLRTTGKTNESENTILMDLFQECVFGYYILTPLLDAKDVSDVKVYDWNKITCKANGERYVTNLSFYDEEDYRRWYDRILRIQRMDRSAASALQFRSDRKGNNDYFLRIDFQLSYITSTETNNIHIRKIPRVKYSWEYLIENGMLDWDTKRYLQDRVVSGFGFLISGRGGSGKTALLNLLIDLIPFNESVLVSQESDELYSHVHPQMQFEHTLDVLTTEGQNITYSLEDELRLGLLQDIDNFVIGEIKGGEALYVFTTGVSTGTRFMGTIHSNNCIGSVKRLAHCARYISDYPVEALEEMLSTLPFVLIHLSHFSIDEIVEIQGWNQDNKSLITHTVYRKSA